MRMSCSRTRCAVSTNAWQLARWTVQGHREASGRDVRTDFRTSSGLRDPPPAPGSSAGRLHAPNPHAKARGQPGPHAEVPDRDSVGSGS